VNQLRFKLPFPPSVNAMWRTPHSGPLAGRTMLSKRGREYRNDVAIAVATQRVPCGTLRGRLAVTLLCNPPDLRARDLDNLPKGLLDSLTKAGVIADDQFIDELHVVRGAVIRPLGQVTVTIDQLPGRSFEQIDALAETA
jgi:crossover junction endodeoxyribonuclease RusA